MDQNAPFLIISGLIAIGLMVLIGYNLVRLDRRERERSTSQPPQSSDESSMPPGA